MTTENKIENMTTTGLGNVTPDAAAGGINERREFFKQTGAALVALGFPALLKACGVSPVKEESRASSEPPAPPGEPADKSPTGEPAKTSTVTQEPKKDQQKVVSDGEEMVVEEVKRLGLENFKTDINEIMGATGGAYTEEQIKYAIDNFPERYQKILEIRNNLIASQAVWGEANLGLDPRLEIDNEGKVEDAYFQWVVWEGQVNWLNGEDKVEGYSPGTVLVNSHVKDHEGKVLWLSPQGASKVIGSEVSNVGINPDTGFPTAWNENGAIVGFVDSEGTWSESLPIHIPGEGVTYMKGEARDKDGNLLARIDGDNGWVYTLDGLRATEPSQEQLRGILEKEFNLHVDERKYVSAENIKFTAFPSDNPPREFVENLWVVINDPPIVVEVPEKELIVDGESVGNKYRLIPAIVKTKKDGEDIYNLLYLSPGLLNSRVTVADQVYRDFDHPEAKRILTPGNTLRTRVMYGYNHNAPPLPGWSQELWNDFNKRTGTEFFPYLWQLIDLWGNDAESILSEVKNGKDLTEIPPEGRIICPGIGLFTR